MSRDTLMPKFFAAVHPKHKTPYRAILFMLPISLAFGYTGLLDQVITFSIFSALMVYLFTAIMMFKFRKMYPLGTIQRGYTAPFHPLPATVLLILTITTLFGMYFGYWVNILSGLVFYLIASLWFTKHRYKFVNNEDFLKTNSWPRPEGY